MGGIYSKSLISIPKNFDQDKKSSCTLHFKAEGEGGAKDLSLIRRLSHTFDREQMNHAHVLVEMSACTV